MSAEATNPAIARPLRRHQRPAGRAAPGSTCAGWAAPRCSAPRPATGCPTPSAMSPRRTAPTTPTPTSTRCAGPTSSRSPRTAVRCARAVSRTSHTRSPSTLILAELGAETTTLTASLLHDTVEDTDVTLDQVREEFGDEVRYLVDGVTKLEKVDYGAAAEPETFRKMLVATGNDVRVMSIKLADRLHNMRTLGVMRPEKQDRIAKVTRDVLIPLAERLGVQALKTELEDLVFAILHPEEYEHTRELIADNAARAERPARRDRRRGARRSCATPASRPKSSSGHGTSSPCTGSPANADELRGSDFGRLLVLVNEDADCYGVLGELHTCFTPVVSEFKDFIAVPKFNLYQSLHTAVARGDGQVAEVLIRTHQMHKVAEAGVVALGNPVRSSLGGADRPSDGRARRPHPARLALPAPRLAGGRARPRHLLVHPARGPRPGPRDHRLPARRRHARACPRARAAWTPRTRSTARTRTPASAPASTAAWRR